MILEISCSRSADVDDEIFEKCYKAPLLLLCKEKEDEVAFLPSPQNTPLCG